MGLNINCSRWPESDIEVMNASINDYINNDNFMAYYISISGHLNYTRLGNTIVSKNWNIVKNLNYSDKVKGYMAAQLELDRSIALLIEKLTQAGKLDDTVIAISPDHYPYGLKLEEINEKSSYIRDDIFEKHHSTFILWNNKTSGEKIDTLCSNFDILPTLANLFGLNYDSRLYMGKDIFSEHEPLVIFSNRSFITNKGRYNSLTKTFIGEEVSDSYISNIKSIIYNKYSISSLILDNDYYKYIK
jgi:phosphoglycerol transferase MdoB-like AlkP superfamily enzyme